MPFRVIAVPVADDGINADTMNAFLRTVQVVGVERHMVTQGQQPKWTFCIEYLAAGRTASPGNKRDAMAKTDYREQLDPATFARFARLRQARKRWAEEAGVPVYALFTNALLAAVAQTQPMSLTALQEIDGIGAAKAGTWGDRVLAVLAEPAPA